MLIVIMLNKNKINDYKIESNVGFPEIINDYVYKLIKQQIYLLNDKVIDNQDINIVDSIESEEQYKITFHIKDISQSIVDKIEYI